MTPLRSARWSIWTIALVLGALPLWAQIEEVKPKPPGPDEKKAGDPALKPEDREAPAAPARLRPTDEEDARRLRALQLRLAEWESSQAQRQVGGLDVRVLLAPDAVAYRTVKEYLERRRQGDDHARAVKRVSGSLPKWKRLRKQALLLVELENPKHKLEGGDRRVYTLEAKNASRLATLTDRRRRKLPLRFADAPEGLRKAKLRIQKFWVTADGATHRVRPPDDAARSDPASIGRRPLLSDPFPAYVLEEKTAKIGLLVSRRILERIKTREFRVSLVHWKKYEGPFEKERLDLNGGRTWKELEDLDLLVTLPPAGLEVSEEMENLVEEVHEASVP